MNRRVQELAAQIRQLEADLLEEVQRIRIQTYEIRDRSVRFREEVRRRHKSQMTRVLVYLRHAQLKHVITAPVIWCCIFPAVFMDAVVTLYQAICFPVYGIPKAKRSDYVVIDRHYLGYLNVIEKLNCLFCSYFNGVIAYVSEVAARTEQYWCPIKHAAQLKSTHSRYARFTDFGDADAWQQNAEALRHDFGDLSAPPAPAPDKD